MRLLTLAGVSAAVISGCATQIPPTETAIDAATLAKCLAERGVTMYGSAGCSHCLQQKKMFGENFSVIPYVECPKDPLRCIQAGIQAYPTWVFSDGKKLQGVQTFGALAEAGGCELSKP